MDCKKTCKKDEVCNPETGRCVKKNGKIGKKIQEAKKKRGTKRSAKRSVTRRSVTRRSATKRSATKRSVTRRSVTRRSVTRRSVTKRSVTKRSVTKRSVTKRSATKRSVSAKRSVKVSRVGCAKICKADEICNPATRKCVKRDGKVGKSIIDGTYKDKVGIESFEPCEGVVCPEDKVCNPLTKKCVLKTSKNGQFILREMILKNVHKKQQRPLANCIERSQIRLNDYQIDTVNAFNNNSSLLVVHEPGMGKTLTAIACAECFLDQNPNSNVVVITMVSLLGNFNKEFLKYGNIDNTRYIFISYETYLSEYKSNKKRVCNMLKNSLLIVDEVHELRNYEGSVFESIMDCIENARKVLLLTATPYVNTMCDFISIINLLEKQYVIAPTGGKQKDKKLFTAPTKIKGCKTKENVWVTGRDASQLLDQIEPFLVGKVSFATKGDDPNYPRKVIKDILIPMEKEYEKIFKVNVLGIDKFYNANRMMVNNINEYYSNKLTYPKVLKLLSNRENKNVIFTGFLKHGVEPISRILESQNVDYSIISGDVSAIDRTRIVREYNEGVVNNLIITTAGMAGIDLIGVTNIIILDPVWNDANLQQIIGRGVRYRSHMHLPEHKRVVSVYLLKLVEKEVADKKIEEKLSRSGDIVLYKFINKKRIENEIVLDMLRRISVVNH